MEAGDLRPLRGLRQLDSRKPFPVSIGQFLDDPEFLGYLRGDFSVWDAHQGLVREMNPDVICGEDPVTETSLGGASGTGKTTLAWINQAYQFYLLTCFVNPQRLFNLAPVTPMVFTMQSLSTTITKLVIYEPFKTMLLSMPYIRRWCSWDKQRESQLDFDDNIHIIPSLARGTSLQGQAVVGGILDELSFMNVIEVSKQVAGPRGQGGKFDQAEEVYTQTINRRNRSFGRGGVSIGAVCAMSNTSYRGDFMDRHMAHIEEHTPERTICRRLRRYEVEPEDLADVQRGETMRVQVGSDIFQTKVLEGGDEGDEGATIIEVPARYRDQFLRDPDGALREVAGISSAAIKPFFRRRDKVVDAFSLGQERGLEAYVDVQDADLYEDGMPEWVPEAMPNDRNKARFIHVDLSKSRDRCGIAIVKPYGLMNVMDEDNPGFTKTVPMFAVECAISLTPSGNVEVEPAVIRDWLMRLATQHGMTIGGVSYDGFQSQESLQIWKKAGVFAKEVSVDRKMEAYEYFRSAIYEDRVALCESDLLLEEIVMLEHNVEKEKVDHPPKGSKDVSDAVCGAIYNASQARYNRTRAGFQDEEGEKVRARGTKDGQRPTRGTRPTNGRHKSRKIKRDVWEVRPAQQERELPEAVPDDMDIVDKPEWWKELHGEK